MSRVLVIGDVMLDEYVFVETTRKAPEANIPVWDEERRECRLGGAANVAHNLKALGTDYVHLSGIMSERDVHLLREKGISADFPVSDSSTMRKTRFIDPRNEFLFRVDNFKRFDARSAGELAADIGRLLDDQIFDIIVISDYDKGTVTEVLCDYVRRLHDGPVIVDSKRRDLRIFSGFSVLKVNEAEYDAQLSSPHYSHVEKLFDYVVVTKGAKGAELRHRDPIKSGELRYTLHTEKFPIEPVKAKDVTGCGDTHTAAMAFSLLKTTDMRASVKFANACARSVVQKFGTALPTLP